MTADAQHTPLPETLEAAHARIAELEARLHAAEITALQRAHTFQTIIDHLPMRLFWKDTESRYLGANRAMLGDLGMRNADVNAVIGRTDIDLGMPEAEIYHADDARVMRSGKPMEHKDELVLRPDGTAFYTSTTKVPLLAGDGTVAGLLGIYQDITRQKQRELMLETLIRQAVEAINLNENLGEAVTVPDLLARMADLPVLRSADAIAFLEYDTFVEGKPTEVVMRGNLIRPGSMLIDVPLGARFASAQFPLANIPIDSPDEPIVISDVSDDPRVDASARAAMMALNIHAFIIVPLFRYGHYIGIFTVSYVVPRPFSTDDHDFLHKLPPVLSQIAERLRLLNELRASIDQLNNALRFKDQFLAIMSHELRTPLNAIMGFSGIMAALEPSTPDDFARLRHMIERVNVNGERLLHLINEVLDLARINTNRVAMLEEVLPLRTVAYGWAEDFSVPAAAKGLEFGFHIDETVPSHVIGDAERLTQIVTNLLENALKFTQAGRIDLDVAAADDKLRIQVHDTGIGIAPVYHQAIFEDFRRVEMDSNRESDGAGIGLSIVTRLAQLMNGYVTVESDVGQGSTFTVMLPLRPANGEHTPQRNS